MKTKFSGMILAGVLLIISSMSLAQAAVQDSTAAGKFNDIAEHWSKGAVHKLLEKNALLFNEDTFRPDMDIKRSEFAMMLRNALDIRMEYFVAPDIKDYFEDIEQNAPYASAVIDLVTANVFEKDGNFKPEGTLTREEMIHYIMQSYKYKMGDRYAMIKINPATFTDTDAITPEYSGEVARAQHDKLIFGNGDNRFEPKNAATRAEAAAVIDRLATLLEEQNQLVTVEPEAIVTDDLIEMKLIITNNTKNDVSIDYTSGQTFDFELLDADRNSLYRWSADKSFIQALSSTKLEAGKTLELSDTLSGDAYKAFKNKIVYMKGYITGVSDFINPEGYEIKLK